MFSWCFDKAVRSLGVRRVPVNTAPVAYSRLPTQVFTRGTDTGLVFQGQFGGIKTHPHLVTQAFSVHTKPFCQRGAVQVCSPFVDAILAPNYQIGMQTCYGQGWLAKPFQALATLHDSAQAGEKADEEPLALHVSRNSNLKGLIPGMNVRYGMPFEGMREGNGGRGAGPGWRDFGSKADKQFCFASLPGAAGKDFMGEFLGPMLLQRFCAHGDCNGISIANARRKAETMWVPCSIKRVWQIFPYNLMSDYPGNSKQPFWLLSMIRNPIDRVLASYASLRARLAEEASPEWGGDAGAGMGASGWSRTLNRWCGDTRLVQYGGNPPPTVGPDMTVKEFVEIPGMDDIMTKFYLNKEWNSNPHGGLCAGGSRPLSYRPGGWEQFHHWQANAGVGALMEYQFFGVWELWAQSAELLTVTLGAELADSADLDPPPEDAKTLLWAGQNRLVEEEVERLRTDEKVRGVIEAYNKKDVMLYQRAVLEFKRRCRYVGIAVPDDPFLVN